MKTFTSTSNEPYDRHYYEVQLDGKTYTFEDYQEVRQFCYNTDAIVHIKDYKKTSKRVSDSKGFG
jgi:hypothetical protein